MIKTLMLKKSKMKGFTFNEDRVKTIKSSLPLNLGINGFSKQASGQSHFNPGCLKHVLPRATKVPEL